MGQNVNANGTTLYTEQDGNGPSLVFVHGMCGDARVWDDQVTRMRDHYRCTTYDRRGHTRSPKTEVVESVELHADDLASLITALDLAPTIVVGSSGGGRIALDLIRRYPQLVRGAVLSEPAAGALAPEAFAAMVDGVRPRLQEAAETAGPRAAVDAFFEAVCPGLWAGIDEARKDRYRDNASMLFADLGMATYEITRQDVERIAVPSLVIAGTQSHPALREVAHNLARWLPDSRYLELECGHVTYAEEPVAFAHAVSTFAGEFASV